MEEEVVDYSIYSLGELQEIIGNYEDKPPKDKRKKEYKEYLQVLNTFFDIYNNIIDNGIKC
jgi:hypothetical protein